MTDNINNDKELVEKYLLGVLSESEQDAVEERLRSDDQLLRELVEQSKFDAAITKGLTLMAEPEPVDIFAEPETRWQFPVYKLAVAAIFFIALGAGWFALTLRQTPTVTKPALPPVAATTAEQKAAPKILDCTIQPDSIIVIKWAGTGAGKTYRIETTTNLMAGFNESIAAGIPSVQPMNCYTVAVNDTVSRYFRVVEERYQ